MGSLLLFPPWTLYNLGMIGHPYTTQLFLWTCILWLMRQGREWSVRKALLLVTLCLLSIWTSELSLLFLPLIAAALWFGQRLRDVKIWLWSSGAMLLGVAGLFLIKMKLPGSGSSFLSFADAAEMRANLDGCVEVFRYYWNKGTLGPWAMGLFSLTSPSWIMCKKTALSKLTLGFGLMALLFTIWSECLPERFRNSILGLSTGPHLAGYASEQGASGPRSSLALAERCSLGRLGFDPLRCRRISLHSRPTQPGRNNRDRRKDRWPCAGRLLEPVPPAGIRSKTEGIAPRALGRAGSLELGRGRSGRQYLVCQSSL